MNRLQEMRTRAGLSQSQLAKASGIKVRALQSYELEGEHGRDFDGAKLQTILKACAALGCSLHDIIEDEETRKLLRVVEKNPRKRDK